MYRDQLISNLNYVMEEKRYQGKMRRFERLPTRILKYGLASIAGGVIFSSGIGAVLMMAYRQNTDSCNKHCVGKSGDEGFTICYNKCYYNSALKITKQIKKELGNLKSIPEDKRKKANRRLRRELEFYTKKLDIYKSKLNKNYDRLKKQQARKAERAARKGK